MKLHLDKNKIEIYNYCNILFIHYYLKMDNDIFSDYVAKVLNNDETKILKTFLISHSNIRIIDKINNFQMLYMPNIEITIETLKNNNKIIYFLSDDCDKTFYHINCKLSLKTLINKNCSIIEIYPPKSYNGKTMCACWSFPYEENYKHRYTDAFNNEFNHTYNAITKRLHDTFMLMNYIFITDIAKYLFLMYYEVTFG